MISTLRNYYEENCGIKNTLFNDSKFVYYMFTKGTLALIVATIILAMLFKEMWWIIVAAFMIYFVVSIFIFNRKAKNALRNQYDFEPEGLMWNSSKASALLLVKEKEIINKHLNDENISIKKLQYYRTKMDDELEELKPKLISFPAFFGAMFIVLYNVILTWWADYSVSIEQFAEFIVYNIFGLIAIGIVSLGYVMMKDLIFDSQFYAKEYYAMKECVKIVDDIIADDELK